MKKEKQEEKYNFKKNNTFQAILNKINGFGKLSLNLGQILLFLIIAGSALNYAKTYILDLNYQVDLTFEQFIAFGFSNLFYAIIYIIFLYIPLEIFILAIFDKNKFIKLIGIIIGFYTSLIAILLFTISHNILFDFIQTTILYYLLLIGILIFLFIFKKENIIRLAYIIISLFIFLITDYSTMKATGIGNYNATIMVDKNSFIKDMFDGLNNENKIYRNKGDHIELKDVKVLSTLGDIAYVELCSENMEIGKTLEKNCGKTIKVEFIKKDIHIIRNGEKRENGKQEDCGSTTNYETKKIK